MHFKVSDSQLTESVRNREGIRLHNCISMLRIIRIRS